MERERHMKHKEEGKAVQLTSCLRYSLLGHILDSSSIEPTLSVKGEGGEGGGGFKFLSNISVQC